MVGCVRYQQAVYGVKYRMGDGNDGQEKPCCIWMREREQKLLQMRCCEN